MRSQLRHLDSLYSFCDDEFGADALDEAISTANAAATQLMLETYFLELTSEAYTTTQELGDGMQLRVINRTSASR